MISLDTLDSIRALLDTTAATILLDRPRSALATDPQVEVIAACRYLCNLTWASLVLPLHLELRRRIAQYDAAPNAGNGRTRTEGRWARERHATLLREASKRVGIRAACVVAERVKDVPSLAWLAPPVMPLQLGEWAEVLMSAVPVEEGGESVGRAEKMNRLDSCVPALLFLSIIVAIVADRNEFSAGSSKRCSSPAGPA
jgi:hypothetical protein